MTNLLDGIAQNADLMRYGAIESRYQEAWDAYTDHVNHCSQCLEVDAKFHKGGGETLRDIGDRCEQGHAVFRDIINLGPALEDKREQNPVLVSEDSQVMRFDTENKKWG